MTVDIEVLLMPDCPNEAAAINIVRTAVADTHVASHITRTVITTEQHARERRFTGSPTILLNGTDPFAKPGQSIGLACRLYSTPAGLQGVPDITDLRRVLKQAAVS